MNHPDSAAFYLQKAKETYKGAMTDLVAIYRAEYEQYLRKEDYKNAHSSYKQLIGVQDSVVSVVLSQPIPSIHRDFLQQRLELETLRAYKEKWIYVSCIVCLVVVLAAVFLFYRTKMNRKKLELEHTMETAQEISLLLDAQRTDLSHMQIGLTNCSGSSLKR